MNAVPVFNPVEWIALAGDRLITTSLLVSKAFNKKHKNVLRAIDNLDCSEQFKRLNFEPSDFIDKNGDRRREVRMTKDGFVFLVMGFTGHAAAAIKEAYINAFNVMTEMLKRQAVSAWRRFDREDLEFRQAKDRVSSCARTLRNWRDEKPQRLRRLDMLHPQLPLLN